MSDDEDTCECTGTRHLFPLQVADGGDISYFEAVAATPPGCVLAPVRTAADLETYALLFPGQDDFYVGVTKDWVAAVETGQLTTSTNEDRTEDWVNLDGSPVPADLDLWIPIGSFEPDGTDGNGVPFTIAYFNFDGASTATGLDDASPITEQAEFALYECCAEATCYEPLAIAALTG
eukprot:CAMPEP_0194046052 /NCGR_PEP_ID=MMETSP0009_2-20130614/19177_1 /TAXON_ID=210454 /ORGANISM="Grammatophora oceanica, Strain CCMP 410" /LENGTH=176 /DNA_ID=CAMNT_0038691175 /DNA_START=129 /DNA_END=659 /DNA_ORIENTATION=+